MRARGRCESRYQPSAAFTDARGDGEDDPELDRPQPTARQEGPARACQRMSTAANAIRPPSKTALKYSILPWP